MKQKEVGNILFNLNAKRLRRPGYLVCVFTFYFNSCLCLTNFEVSFLAPNRYVDTLQKLISRDGDSNRGPLACESTSLALNHWIITL